MPKTKAVWVIVKIILEKEIKAQRGRGSRKNNFTELLGDI